VQQSVSQQEDSQPLERKRWNQDLRATQQLLSQQFVGQHEVCGQQGAAGWQQGAAGWHGATSTGTRRQRRTHTVTGTRSHT
jgi:hypothetical protein